MDKITLDVLFFAMCFLTPFVVIFAVSLHFVWRYLTHNHKPPIDDKDI